MAKCNSNISKWKSPPHKVIFFLHYNQNKHILNFIKEKRGCVKTKMTTPQSYRL